MRKCAKPNLRKDCNLIFITCFNLVLFVLRESMCVKPNLREESVYLVKYVMLCFFKSYFQKYDRSGRHWPSRFPITDGLGTNMLSICYTFDYNSLN